MYNICMKVIILHGTGNSSKGNWFPWLQKQLEAKGHKVWLPDLPSADQPDPNNYTPFILESCPFKLDSQTIIVGHSSGAVEALYLIQQNSQPIKGMVLVGAFDEDLGWPALSKLFPEPFDYAKIKKNGGKILLLHSDNDPHVPLETRGAKRIAAALDAPITVLHDMGHFSLDGGERFRQLPEILPLINKASIS